MATLKQIEANRINAQKSTGPRTDPGKAVASRNALKHGLFSRATLFPGEDPDQFARLAESLHAHYQPEGAEEEILVQRLASLWWRLNRHNVLEVEVFRHLMADIRSGYAEPDDERPSARSGIAIRELPIRPSPG